MTGFYVKWDTGLKSVTMYVRILARFGTVCTILEAWKTPFGGVLFLVKLQAKACSFIKSNTYPWVFLVFFYIVATNDTKLRKASQIIEIIHK